MSSRVVDQDIRRTTSGKPAARLVNSPASTSRFDVMTPVRGNVPFTGRNAIVPLTPEPDWSSRRSNGNTVPARVKQFVQPSGTHVRITKLPTQCPTNDV